jgi:hypothetical protein
MDAPSPAAAAALRILRDPHSFQWTLVPLFGIVVYLYCVEIGKERWNVIAAGAAYYGIEWVGEILNSLFFHFSGYAPLWGEPGPTAYLILVGINAETTLMFMLFGLAVGQVLRADRRARVLGVPHRLFVILGFSLFCALIESALHAWGALTWDWWWWGWPHIWSVMLFAYGPAVAFTVWVHDMESPRAKALVLGAVYALVALGLFVFVRVLHWI